MATFFRNVVEQNIGTTPTTLLTTGSTSSATCIGLSLSNLTQGVVFVSLKVVGGGSDPAWYLKDVPITANTTLKAINGGEKLILEPDDQLIVEANTDDSLDCVLSYVEIV